MTVEEAIQVLHAHAIPDDDFSDMSEYDILMLAEAHRDQHRCAYCGEQAESKCPICGKWTCWDDRRDWSPDFDQHWCPDCVGKNNRDVLNALAVERGGL